MNLYKEQDCKEPNEFHLYPFTGSICNIELRIQLTIEFSNMVGREKENDLN